MRERDHFFNPRPRADTGSRQIYFIKVSAAAGGWVGHFDHCPCPGHMGHASS